jgi:hypothetical protein
MDESSVRWRAVAQHAQQQPVVVAGAVGVGVASNEDSTLGVDGDRE